MTPIIASILSAALPSVISLVEKLRGPKTGTEKFNDVFAAAIALLQALAARGIAPKEINDNSIKALIETLVQSMKLDGKLDAPGSPSNLPVGSILKLQVIA